MPLDGHQEHAASGGPAAVPPKHLNLRYAHGEAAPIDGADRMNEDTPSLLAQAVALHQQGALAPAQALYRPALAAAPRQANALHLLGVLLGQRGRPDEAIPLIAAAVAEAPEE